jgi:hypothetical protein
MAILDPPFSILDLANAHALPLRLFEQPVTPVRLTKTGGKGQGSSKQDICISHRTC